MHLEEIKKLIDALEKSGLTKLILKQDDFELHLEKPQVHSTVAVCEPKLGAPPPIENKVQEPHAPIAKGTPIESPMVGTFYNSPSPDLPVFVKVGDSVAPDTVVCIIEAMKVMNEVKAGVSGKVVEVLVENGEPVEFGTPLFRVI